MVSKPLLVRFVEPIVRSAIGDNYQTTHKYIISQMRLQCLDVKRCIGDLTSIKNNVKIE